MSGKTNYDILKEYEAHGEPLPNYDEWKQLKELLKDCKVSVLNLLSRDVIECNGINQAELLVEIDEVQDE